MLIRILGVLGRSADRAIRHAGHGKLESSSSGVDGASFSDAIVGFPSTQVVTAQPTIRR